MKYDYLVVGAGLFGAVFTYEAKKRGKSVLVIDRRDHIAGNVYTENVRGHQRTQLRRPYFPHEQQRSLGLCEPASPSSTTISTLRLPSTRTSFTTCLSI